MRWTLAAAAVAVAAADCTYVSNNDYDQGSGGPNFPATNASACCAMCVAAGSAACYAAVFDPMTGGVCWYKTQAQTKQPVWSPGLSACWPPGSVPPPSPSPPPPPPPPLYSVNVTVLPRERQSGPCPPSSAHPPTHPLLQRTRLSPTSPTPARRRASGSRASTRRSSRRRRARAACAD